jgi:hypothetical protein
MIDCEYFYYDYVYEDDDDIPIPCCDKGINLEHCCPECVAYKKFMPEPYIEKDTACDLCEYQKECGVIEVTSAYDTRRHYMPSLGTFCKRIK